MTAPFSAKWSPGGPACHFNEEQGAQSYFTDLCELLVVPNPAARPASCLKKNAIIGGRKQKVHPAPVAAVPVAMNSVAV